MVYDVGEEDERKHSFMAVKFYAVKKGIQTGIFTSWEQCRASVHGYSGAVYKSFPSRQEAESYLSGEEAEKEPETLKGGEEKPEETALGTAIYVDGSFCSESGEFSYGMVVLTENGEETFCRKFQDSGLAAMRNVAGEIKGAQAAMQYAMDHQLSEITIYHDYEGIARWCLGDWKANKEGTKAYRDFYEKAKEQVRIHFKKVTGHSGDHYNDMADQLAKQALGIK